MRCVLSAPFAKLGKLNFALNFFLVFAAPVADFFTALTLEFYEIILRHTRTLADYFMSRNNASYADPGVNPVGGCCKLGAAHFAPSQTPP